jgi:hypothetical protein
VGACAAFGGTPSALKSVESLMLVAIEAPIVQSPHNDTSKANTVG